MVGAVAVAVKPGDPHVNYQRPVARDGPAGLEVAQVRQPPPIPTPILADWNISKSWSATLGSGRS